MEKMSSQDIDQFLAASVVEINGSLFIAKDTVTNMLIKFAEQQIEKETAQLREELNNKYEIEIAYKEKFESLQETISELTKGRSELKAGLTVMIDDRDNYQHIYHQEEKRADEMQNLAHQHQVRGDDLLAQLQALQEENEKLKECLVNDNTVNEARIQSLSARIKKFEEGLIKIASWELPETGKFWDEEKTKPESYEVAYGSNGVRDYFKQLAQELLTK